MCGHGRGIRPFVFEARKRAAFRVRFRVAFIRFSASRVRVSTTNCLRLAGSSSSPPAVGMKWRTRLTVSEKGE